MTTAIEHIEDARKKLLDLTLRNRLLNYRPTKARTIKILKANPQDIYEILVLKEKSIQFRATKTPEDIIDISSLSENNSEEVKPAKTELPESESTVWTPHPLDHDSDNQQKVRFLDTPYDTEALTRHLLVVARESKSVLEEQGYTILYLALGFLEWYEDASLEKSSRAPLILIPVELKREEVRDSFKLQWTGEDIMTNISLKEKLRDVGVLLPDFSMPEDKSGIDDYFGLVQEAISKQKNWKIFSDTYLDFFSFTKFVMYKDLDLTTWTGEINPVNHPLITAIFNPDTTAPAIPGFNEEEVDEKIPADLVYHILDADSSQIAAIEDIKAGRNLVIQGPPGTGKSQTIANAIADLLAQGKTVLFISEKMAALEVVKKRLDHVGVGDFCLELHSRKSNIKEVHRRLQKTLDMIQPRKISPADQFARIEELKEELNSYSQVLNTPVGQRGLTPFCLFGQSEKAKKHFAIHSREFIPVPLPGADQVSEREWQAGITALKKLVEVLPRVRPVQRHPWYGCKPGIVLPADHASIKAMIQNMKSAYFDLQNRMEILAELTGLSFPDNLVELKNAIGATKLFVSPNPIDRNLLLNDAWNQPNAQVTFTIKKIETFQQMRDQILTRFDGRILDENLDQFLREFIPLTDKFVLLKILNSRYRALRHLGDSFYLDHKQHSDNEIVNDFSSILKCINEREQIRKSGDIGRSLFGSLWLDEDSNTRQLSDFSGWIVQFRRKMLEEVFTARTVDMMSTGVSPAIIEKAAQELTRAWQHFIRYRFELFERLHFNTEGRFLQDEENLEFSKYQLLLSLWDQNISLLTDWSHYADFSEDCQATYARHMLRILEEQDLSPADIIPAFEGNYADELLRKAFNEHPELSRFLGDTHEQKIRTFVDLDKKMIETNRYRLIGKLYETMPDIEAEASPKSALGILKQQFNRKRGMMPIRQLITTSGNLIQKINPCFMMGPLSVAQFLDPKTIRFDVIIFDEASQVRPEDALGALLRGNQAVVIGDSKQLPPTSFFDKMIEDELEEFDETSSLPSQMESILNLCKVSFPVKTLRWHYRSRHESLIALSNAEFYENKLYVYPSPQHRSKDIGLQFVHLPGTVYGRGSSQSNPEEALAVAKAVFDHFTRYPDKSLGVGTFNIKQQQAIIDAVESLRRNHPEMERFFHEDNPENFFVKNLETIQGDERDVIFISVGYGKDSTGVLHRNFGPLNLEGGERRLNVLITRARVRCVVFSNFTSNDLQVTATSPIGMRVLKLFLEYAKSGILPNSSIPGGDSESPFEDAVYDFLDSNNYQVHKQIGCAGFRIDMAIVDPGQPGRYLLGIECDGAQYHSSKVARDRDRLRQQILEGLDWRIHRVWSTDWYRNSPDTKRKLLETIEKVKSQPVEETPKPKSEEIPDSPFRSPDIVETPPPGITNRSPGMDTTSIPDYKICTTADLGLFIDFAEVRLASIENAIVEIVAVEGPVHIEEVYERIRDIGNIPRMTGKIKDRIIDACDNAAGQKRIRLDYNFLWPPVMPATILRRRNANQGTDISWICNDEISDAVFFVLSQQFATEMEDLIGQVLKIFGFQKSSDKSRGRIRKILSEMITDDELVVLSNGMIDIRK
jgi:very-short-patch-repair endonuclease